MSYKTATASSELHPLDLLTNSHVVYYTNRCEFREWWKILAEHEVKALKRQVWQFMLQQRLIQRTAGQLTVGVIWPLLPGSPEWLGKNFGSFTYQIV